MPYFPVEVKTSADSMLLIVLNVNYAKTSALKDHD
jgi:hypothetical protein